MAERAAGNGFCEAVMCLRCYLPPCSSMLSSSGLHGCFEFFSSKISWRASRCWMMPGVLAEKRWLRPGLPLKDL